MTAPRQVVAGASYLVTRRCTQREFLLKPSRVTSRVFLYVLALAAQRFDIRVHGFCVLSNHFHIVLRAPGPRVPDFSAPGPRVPDFGRWGRTTDRRIRRGASGSERFHAAHSVPRRGP